MDMPALGFRLLAAFSSANTWSWERLCSPHATAQLVVLQSILWYRCALARRYVLLDTRNRGNLKYERGKRSTQHKVLWRGNERLGMATDQIQIVSACSWS